MQNNSKIILLVLMFIIVFSFVRVEKMTASTCQNKSGREKMNCLKNHINNVLDPDNKYYRYHNGNPRFGAGPIKSLNGKITHFENMITAFNNASNELSKYCAGMTDNNPKIKCREDRLGSDEDEETHHNEIVAAGGNSCKTMKPYHRCFKHIVWAKNTGSISNPNWYKGTDTKGKPYQLSKNSTTKDFQNHLFKQGEYWTQDARGDGKCPVSTPCYANGEKSQIQK